MATIKDVAKLAGVSVTTVSRVLNGNNYVNKDTEDKVRKAIITLNYRPNVMARGLASKKSNAIALIVPDITNPFYPELARAVEDTAQKYGYTLILGNSDNEEVKQNQYIEILKNRYVDGIIFASKPLNSSEIHELNRINIPIVAIDRAADMGEIASIRVNQYRGAVLAVEHLISVGCRKIAHICGPLGVSASVERLQGCIDTLESAELFNPALVVQGDFTIESGMKKTMQVLKKYPDIDGIFAANDLMAVGALKALVRLNRQVPDQVALIGFDDISLTVATEPEISTIAQPIYEMGSLAVHRLIEQISQESHRGFDVMELEAKLILRTSTLKSD